MGTACAAGAPQALLKRRTRSASFRAGAVTERSRSSVACGERASGAARRAPGAGAAGSVWGMACAWAGGAPDGGRRRGAAREPGGEEAQPRLRARATSQGGEPLQLHSTYIAGAVLDWVLCGNV